MTSCYRRCSAVFILATLALVTIESAAIASEATLTLDSLSFISFQDEHSVSLPAGSTIRFQFQEAKSSGAIPFLILPADIATTPVGIPSLRSTMQYSLSATATGLLTATDSGIKMHFNGAFTASDLKHAETRRGATVYSIDFTTEHATAKGRSGGAGVEAKGVRVSGSANYVRLVGATVSRSENAKGVPVYVVLSGTFDWLPTPSSWDGDPLSTFPLLDVR